MKTVPLGELMVSKGGSVSPEKHPNETFELYSIPSYDRRKPEILQGKQIGSSKKCVSPDDVLLSRIVPHIRRAWVVNNETGQRQIASGEWIIFRGDSFDSNYLRHFLLADRFHQQFMKTVSGVGGSLLRARPSEVEKIKIPLPPLEEQKWIAAILDKAYAIRKKRNQALELTEQFLHSAFLDMFGDPITNPKGWEKKTLRETKSLVQIGPFGSLLHKEDYISGGIPLINPKHIINSAIVIGSGETVTQAKADELKNYCLQEGDVIMGRRGEMGRCAVVSEKIAGMLCGTGSLFIRPTPNVLTQLYLSKVLSSDAMKAHLEREAWGVTMANLNRSKVESLSIPLPPIDLQQGFADIVEQAEKQKARLCSHLEELDNLFVSLQSHAFRSELN